jgi:hypothetical protein
MFFSWEGISSTLLLLISACFEFDSVIYCNFCSFWVSFIYWWLFAVALRLVDYLILFLLIFVLMEFFTFLWKTNFVKKDSFLSFFFSKLWKIRQKLAYASPHFFGKLIYNFLPSSSEWIIIFNDSLDCLKTKKPLIRNLIFNLSSQPWKYVCIVNKSH